MQIQHQAAKKGENFPVVSFMLQRSERINTLIFYDYVRALDNIADDPYQTADARLAALMDIDSNEQLWAKRYREAVEVGQIDPQFAQKLHEAFVQDTQKSRYQSWDELMNYCALSAMPVGRYLLWLWREDTADVAASDALCALLQILNHLQDMKQDYEKLGRLYLPKNGMREHGASEAMLTASQISPPLRAVLDAMLAECDLLYLKAYRLPRSLKGRRHRFMAGWTLQLAKKLMQALYDNDPLAERVRLTKRQYLLAGVGALRYVF